MNKPTLKISSIIAVICLVMSCLPLFPSADELPDIQVQFKNDASQHLVSLYIVNPMGTAITDAEISFDSDAFDVSSISAEGTDISEYELSEDAELSEENNYFLYSYTEKKDRISFSGYFLKEYDGAKEKLHILDISFTSKTEAELLNEMLGLDFTISGADFNISGSCTYSFATGAELSHASALKEHFMGDVNMDNKVTAADARTVLRYSVGLDKIPLEGIMYANTDFDNKISASDARTVLRTSVGLEELSIQSFSVRLTDSEDCESGGAYEFTCEANQKSFTLTLTETGHLANEADCYLPASCKVCAKILEDASGHDYDENGCCTRCGITKSETDAIRDKLLPLFDEIALNDTAAYEAAESNDLTGYFTGIMQSTKLLGDAISVCADNQSFRSIRESLETAYSLRFDAILKCTDENGRITVTRSTYNYVHAEVKKSDSYIDTAATTFRN